MSPAEIRYQEIFEKYYNKILTYIHARLYVFGLSGDLDEDLTQSVFQTLWQKWDENRYKTDEILLRWLYNTANYKLQEAHRSEDAMEHENIDDHEWDLAAPDRIGEIDERLTNDAQMRELEAFLEPRLCRLLTLIADGYRYRECARILGILY